MKFAVATLLLSAVSVALGQSCTKTAEIASCVANAAMTNCTDKDINENQKCYCNIENVKVKWYVFLSVDCELIEL